MAVVKNRMGSIGSFNFIWNGLTGDLSEMDDMELAEFNQLLERKAAEKMVKDGGF